MAVCRLRAIALHALLLPGVCLAAATAGHDGLIRVEDFARHPEMHTPRLSPDGKYLAVRVDKGDGVHALAVYRLSDMSVASVLGMPKYQLPLSPVWVSPTRLVIEKGKETGSLETPTSMGELFAIDFDGDHREDLYGSRQTGRRASTRSDDQGWGSIEGVPASRNGHFYMRVQPWDNDDVSVVYDVDAVRNTRRQIGKLDIPGMSFLMDPDGRAEFAYGENTDFKYVVYRQRSGAWTLLDSGNTGTNFVPFAYGPDGHTVYASWSADGGPDQLISADEDGGNRKILARDDFSSIDNVEWTAPPRRLFAAVAAAGIPKPVFIDPDLPDAKLYQVLAKAFPGEFVDFINFSDDGGKLLFSVSSDRDPGTYYVLDTGTLKASKLFAVEPWITPSRMAERRPFRFKASDGLELEGILTLPPHRGETNLPMVLLPHGGPHGPSDDWFYDNDAQFLASRGYLVLQVNYRGSGGRGDTFTQAGYLKWGTRIQQDLIDGVKWAESQQYADSQRVCVYGGSFGAYSALMTTIRAPGLFKCAVGYAGIYDLGMMYKKGDVRQNQTGRSYLTSVIGTDDADLDANSPDKLADKITVPVLLVHGKDDKRAPYAQALAMRDALDAAHKPYEWLAKSGEGHGFYAEKNNVEFYNRLQAFLERNIGSGAPERQP